MSGLTRPRTWAVALCAGLLTLTVTIALSAQAARQAAPAQGIITGVVQGENGPEAGVWVIAETKDLPTNFIKIVVTDDNGRFLVPDLPTATYSVFVRGYEWSLLPIHTPTASAGAFLFAGGARNPYAWTSRLSLVVPVLYAAGRRRPFFA